ncbi:hypothetical protein [Oleisolibacter albus]|uniref:hypothetical protein n=1 Tax=Oleisolibacter albus TaxID=2171757 RepID=UPI000DF380F3|nr:hypothetical protein [Oleisolibacter albus]
MRAPLLGIAGAIVSVLGLFMAAGPSHEPAAFLGGALFFLFGVLLNFWLIARANGHHGVAAE